MVLLKNRDSLKLMPLSLSLSPLLAEKEGARGGGLYAAELEALKRKNDSYRYRDVVYWSGNSGRDDLGSHSYLI